MSWRRNFADYQNELSQKSADKLIDNFVKLYEQAASEMIPMFLKVYEEAWDVAGIKKLAPETLYHLDSYWALLDASRQRAEALGNDIITMMNDQFHTMYADVFEGIAPGDIQLPCFIDPEEIQKIIDGSWGVDKKNWRERIWIKMTVLWDKLTGALMEAIIKHHTEKKLQATLQKEFEGSRKALNSTMMIDVSRIQAKAAMRRQMIVSEIVGNKDIYRTSCIMTYGDEAEINKLPAESVAAVNELADIVRSENDTIVKLFSSRRGKSEDNVTYYLTWVTEGDDLVCDDCKEFDNQQFVCKGDDELIKVEDQLPIHPNCRCCLEYDYSEGGDEAYEASIGSFEDKMASITAKRRQLEARRDELYVTKGVWAVTYDWE
jgi:hypothetical protein